ncbi:MAG: NUDIX domain-containing protein [Candidatus Woesearchaeota archaeon]|nr:MAG: NUDIX domain-containing protein [Candidatus Woesearchaeota archaeon]
MNLEKAHYVVATAIVIKYNKYLVIKRAPHEKVRPNYWTVPGGKIEKSDYINRKVDIGVHWYNIIEDVLRREVLEETGLKIKNIRYLTSLVFVRPDNIPTIVLSMYADYESGEIKLDKDHTDYAWVTLEEAKDYKLIEGIYEEIEMLDRKLKGEDVDEWSKSKNK